jgi:DNA polymerase
MSQVATAVATAVGSKLRLCHIDIETFSKCNLKKCGVFRYAEDPSTEILIVCYSFGNGLVTMWIPVDERDLPQGIIEALWARVKARGIPVSHIYVGKKCPGSIVAHALAGGEFGAHNAQFERTLLNGRPGQRIGFPRTNVPRWKCTAAKAAAHGLPRALGNAATTLGTYPKNEEGVNAMRACTKPRKPTKGNPDTRWTPRNAPDKFLVMWTYCVDDVLAERDLDIHIPDLTPYERRVWGLDQRINDRGVRIDVEFVDNIQFLIDQYKAHLEKLCVKWTGFAPTQTEKLGNWVRAQGYPIENLQAPTMKEAIKDKRCPKHVRRVLQLRAVHSMKAVSKYKAIRNAVCSDGRLHGMFLYYGANTGRWSSLIVQLQNLFRSKIKDPNAAIDLCAARDLALIKALYDGLDPMIVFASAVRGALISDIFCKLLALDFSAIEARMIAWLSGQEDILEVFREHGKIYEYTAGQIYHVDWRTILDPSDERFIGKIATLALGYQGGWKAFAKMAKQYGVEISREQAEAIKLAWRAANKKIVKFWYDLEDAAKCAVMHPGAVYSTKNKKIMFKVQGNWLYMRLPSGRRLAYFKPELDEDDKITYLGIDTYSRRWMRVSTYGGKLAENATQAAARDLMVNGLLKLEDAGYEPIGSVHDEGICEIEDGFGSLDEAKSLMCDLPKWAAGLPVKANGFIADRYRK